MLINLINFIYLMSPNLGNLPKNQSFGRFRLDREDEIDSLASRISGQKPELLEVVLGDEGYIVSYFKKNQVPPATERGRVGEFPITKKEVTDFLYSAAAQLSSNQAKRVVIERVNNLEGKACYKNYSVIESER